MKLTDVNQTREKVLEQSLEINRIQADLIKGNHKTNRLPWIALFIVVILWFATICAGIWLWNQYDTVTSYEYEATGVYAMVDSSGNMIAHDVSEEQFEQFKELNKDNGNSESESDSETSKEEH